MPKSHILGLRTVIYKVDNIEMAKAWYSDAFKTEPYFDEAFYVGYNIGGYELGLMPADSVSEAKNGGATSYWGVENIETEYLRFIDMGAEENEPPENVGGDIMTASVEDPWGNIIGLIYNPHFKLE